VQREPHNALAWIMLCEYELDAGDARAGEAAARRALALQPGHPEALARLGRAQWMQQQRTEAAASLRAAAANAPRHPGIAVWLGHVLEEVGEAEAAPMLMPAPMRWRRTNRRSPPICWRGAASCATGATSMHLAMQVRAAVREERAMVEPFASSARIPPPPSSCNARACAPGDRAIGAPVASRCRTRKRGPAACRLPLQRLRCASDRTADRRAVRGAARDGRHRRAPVRTESRRRQPGAAAPARRDPAARRRRPAARAGGAHIREAGIDVLFDLRGWGGGGAPEVLAMRPAPVQVNWLALPGTSGAPWIDYVLADGFALPAALAEHYSERVVRLPRCFQPTDTARALPPAPSRRALRAARARRRHGVLLLQQQLQTQSAQRGVAPSRCCAASRAACCGCCRGQALRTNACASSPRHQDVDPRRLVFMPKQPHAEYMARLQHADLFLDTEPYNAHTTASDACGRGARC
jgi:hypothetical protein